MAGPDATVVVATSTPCVAKIYVFMVVVENLTSSAKQVALAELRASDSGNVKLVVANVRAMCAALRFADELSAEAIIQMHGALLDETAPQLTGHFRDRQVWIGGGSFSPHEAQFVPLHHEQVPDLKDDLVQFCTRTDIPALAHAALAHAQFETIHPFPDGNGRIGRALVHSMLRRAGLTRNISVPVFAGILHDTRRYVDALTACRDGSLTEIVEVFADAAFSAVANSRTLVDELGAISQRWEAIPTRRGSAGCNSRRCFLDSRSSPQNS